VFVWQCWHRFFSVYAQANFISIFLILLNGWSTFCNCCKHVHLMHIIIIIIIIIICTDGARRIMMMMMMMMIDDDDDD